jgi:Transposase
MLKIVADEAAREDLAASLDEIVRERARRMLAAALEDEVGELHALVAAHAADGEPVAVGIEVDRGLVVTALLAAGYLVYAVNPLAVSRYRDRHASSRAKSDRGDAKVLADLVRTDRHNHRQVAGDSDLADAVRVLARAHQSAIWSRQRQVNALRSALREYYPAALAAFGTDLAASDAVAVLALAPVPAAGRALSQSKIASALRRAGRQRNIGQRANEIQAALRADYLHAPAAIAGAYGAAARSAIRLISAYTAEIAELEQALPAHFEQHPDAKIVHSLPGLGTVLGARVLGEFGDDRTRFASPSPARTTPARHPSPGHPAAATSCWPATPATGAWPTPRSNGRSAPSPIPPAPAPTTTSSGPAAKPTARRCASSPTAGSASSTSASSAASSTTKPPPGTTWKAPPLDTFHRWGV